MNRDMKNMSSKNLRLVIILLVILAAVVAISLIPSIQKGVYVERKFYKKTSDSTFAADERNQIQAMGHQQYHILYHGESMQATLTWDETNPQNPYVRVLYSDGSGIEGYYRGQMIWQESDDAVYLPGSEKGNAPITFPGQEPEGVDFDHDYLAHCNLAIAMCQIERHELQLYGDKKRIFDFQSFCIVAGCIIYIITIYDFLHPGRRYYKRNSWLYKNWELSEDGMKVSRLMSVANMGLGLGIILIGLLYACKTR